MARRRHYRGLVRFPGLGSLSLPSSIKPVDVLVGLALGLAGAVALKKGAAAAGITLPAVLASPVAGGIGTGAVLYLAQRKKNASRAGGHAVGAAVGGLAVWAYGMLQSNGVLGDLRTLPNGYGAPIFDNPRMMDGFHGPIFDNPNTQLAGIARLQGLGDENEDGMFPAP